MILSMTGFFCPHNCENYGIIQENYCGKGYLYGIGRSRKMTWWKMIARRGKPVQNTQPE